MKLNIHPAILGVTALAMAFAITGCGQKSGETQEAPKETATPEAASTVTPSPTPDPSISVKSADGNIQINLPDYTWKGIEEDDGMYVFNSAGNGTITITRNTEISGIRLPESEEAVLDYLEDMGDDVSAMTVSEYKLTDIGTDNLRTVTYTVKNDKGQMHPYLAAYIILHTDELYDATALAEKDAAALLESLQKSVSSLQVLHEDHPASKVTPIVTAAPAAAQTAAPQATATPAATQASPQEPVRTGESMALYDTGSNTQVMVYELSDGEWVDDNGMNYYAQGAGQWSDDNGVIYSTTQAGQETGGNENAMTLYSANGSVTITQDADGNWHDDVGVNYYAQGAGQWSDDNGNSYTDVPGN